MGMKAAETQLAGDLDLRPYRPGDERVILALFEASFGRPLSLAYWRWCYRDHPAGGPWIELAWDGDRLASHYAVCATTLSIEGKPVPAALSMTTMTHPAYRGRGLFPRLAKRLYARLEAERIALVYGFPNAASHRGFVRELGWRDLYEIPTLRLSLAATSPREQPPQVQPMAAPDARLDRLWQRIKTRFAVWSWRDARHLTWRFAASPDGGYTFAAWEDGSEIRGYVAVKRYPGRSLDIIDLIAESEEVAGGLVDWAVVEARAAALPGLATWCPPHALWRLPLERAGFVADAPVSYLSARVFEPSARRAEMVQAWGYAMADCDAF
jgi:GNAT superfamily N-acetyltransferase